MAQIEVPDEVDVDEMSKTIAQLMMSYEFDHEDALIVFFMAGMIMLLAEGGDLMH